MGLKMRSVLSIALLGCSLYMAWIYPFASIFVACLLGGYYCLLMLKPLAWVFWLSVFLPVLNFAPWSGIVLFEEFDLIILVTIAASIMNGYYKIENFKKFRIPAVLFLISIIISLGISLLPGFHLNANAFSNYLSPYNSIRIGRSFLWAVLLFPVLVESFNPENHLISSRNMIAGFTTGVFLLGIVIFWERGVINDLLHASSIYDPFRSLFDFSDIYRTTALFSEMNTGGSAIDGFAGMTWVFPLTGYLMWTKKTSPDTLTIKGMACLTGYAITLCLALYIIATTFTRITYLSFAVSLVLFGTGYLLSSHNTKPLFSINLKSVLFGFAACLGLILLFFRSYVQGGYVSLAAGFFVFAVAFMRGVFFSQTNRILSMTILCFGWAAGTYLMAKSSIISKWNPSQFEPAVIESMIVSLVILIIGGFAGKFFLKTGGWKYLGLIVPVLLVAAVAIPVMSGYRMQERFSASAEDADTRFGHWKDVIEVMDNSWRSTFFGMGLGSFPRTFFQKKWEARNTGWYEYVEESDFSFLRLFGGSDMELGQRLLPGKIDPDSSYKVRIKARSHPEMPFIHIRFCSRNLMHAGGCKYYKAGLTHNDGNWGYYAADIAAGELKNYTWYADWPKVFLVRNKSSGTILDISEIVVLNNDNRNILANHSFDHGGQNWFSYNEFEHLPWHAKNMFLHFFFEQGMMGLLSFIAMVASVVFFSAPKGLQGDLYALGYTTAIAGFMVVGITGTLVDAPRVMFLFYMVLSAAYFHCFAKADG